MATQWYWHQEEQTFGPVSFQELVGMVRDHVLNEDHLVRPHYTQDWQTTDTVVGLYHMANRVPVPRQPKIEPDTAPYLTLDAECPSSIQVYRLDDVAHDRIADAGATIPAVGGDSVAFSMGDDLVAILAAAPDADEENLVDNDQGRFVATPVGFQSGNGGGSSQWDSVVQSAVDRVDERGSQADAEKSRRGWFGRLIALYDFMGHSETLRQLFRITVAVICCLGFGVWAVEYDKYEMSRFPTREQVEHNLRFFPLIGTCESTDYWAILCLSVLVLGAFAYWGAWEIEQRWLELD